MGKGRPAVVVFTRDVGKDLAGLVKEIDNVAATAKDFFSYVVYLDDDKKAATKKLQDFAQANKVRAVDMTLNQSGATSPRGYNVNPKVKHTVLVYEKNKVVHNFALNSLDKKSVGAVVAAVTTVFKGSTTKASGKKARSDREDKRSRRNRKRSKDRKPGGKDPV